MSIVYGRRLKTDYQCYRSMKWTTEDDRCEWCNSRTMDEDFYVSGHQGHYCTKACRDEAEG